MTKYSVLKKKFGPDKRLTRLVAVRKPCQLGFLELLAYSTLIFRVDESGCTASRLSRLSGLDRTKTVPKVLARLSVLGLAVQQGKSWFAVAPVGDVAGWFVWQKADQLKNQFRYNWIAVPGPDSPLTNIQAAIVTQLVLKMSHASIARFLRVSVKTVGRVVKLLADNGQKYKLAWFQDKGAVVVKKKVAVVKEAAPTVVASLAGSVGITDGYLGQQLDRNCKLMGGAGIDQKQQHKFWGQVVGKFADPNGDQCEGLLFSFGARLGKIQSDHNHNKKEGKADAPNCYFLLCHEYKVKP
jgi:hypothetical protein